MDYSSFREAGHKLVDYITEYLQTVQDKPLFNEVEPATLHELFEEPIPDSPLSLEKIHELLEEKLIPYCTHVNHKGYMGLITPSPNPAGILGDFLAHSAK